MAWYYGTYSCGHDGRVNIIGPMKDREWKKEREFSKLCPDCWKKHLEEKRERENREAAKRSQEMELPELMGTPKQVAWANTIRMKMIEAFNSIDEAELDYIRLRKGLRDLTLDDVKKILFYILENKTSANYYIDRRFDSAVDFILREKEVALVSDEDIAQQELLEQEKAKATVYPTERETDSVVGIDFNKDEVTARFEKNEKFRITVRELGYRWDGEAWKREISYTTGSAEDRAAELGNKLLNAGFPICIFDEEVRRKAIEGDYEPECHRWILHQTGTKNLAIRWKGFDDDLYRRAKSLPGARWNSGSMLVGVEHYELVEEFADLMGFRFTKAARKLIDEYKSKMSSIKTVQPAKVEEPEKQERQKGGK